MIELSEKISISQDRLVAFQTMLREARKRKGCKNQQEAEDAIRAFYGDGTGVSQSLISNLERGVLDNRQIFPFYRYIHWLGFTMSEIFQTLGLEKTLDVEENDRNVRFHAMVRQIEGLPEEKRRTLEDAISALVNGFTK